jgi:6-phospho-3-hexuloisomerase
MLALTTRADSTLAGLADVVIEVPTDGTGQFGGSLFEQGALLLIDALVLDLTCGDPRTYAVIEGEARQPAIARTALPQAIHRAIKRSIS